MFFAHTVQKWVFFSFSKLLKATIILRLSKLRIQDISRDFKIECTVCTDFIACIDCFAAGAQLDSHKNTHPYRIIPSFHDPLFTFDWSGQDELRLISQIKSKGFGNWR